MGIEEGVTGTRVAPTNTGRRKRRNRRLREPLRRRLPPLRTWRQVLARTLRRMLPALTVLGAIAGTGLLLWGSYRYATTSPRFAVDNVEVVGGEKRDAVWARAALGIDGKDNIFRIDPNAMAKTLEADPWVARAHVRRELPDTVVIELDENQPVALVELDGLYLTTQVGALFKRARIANGEGEALPVITGFSRRAYLQDPAPTAAAIRRALALLSAYRADPSRPVLGEIHWDPARGFTLLSFATGLAIRVGSGDDQEVHARLAAFDAAWDALDADERKRARVVHATGATRPDYVTVSF